MVTVTNNKVTMTRGDTLRLKVDILVNDEPYAPQENDVVRFAMKHDELNEAGTDFADVEPLVEKTIPNETLVLELVPGDTKPLGFGKYAYDIQITFADGTVDTFISDTIKLTKEVE